HWDEHRAVEQTRRLLQLAIEKQVMSDVPVGVFISSGLDSTLLATLASKLIGAEKVHTFSAQFSEQSYDESAQAAEAARRMRTRHVQVRTDEVTLRHALERVVSNLAEPIADPAILPTVLLAQEARERVKVILSGEGADELFGGYPTYLGHKLAPHFERLPAGVRRIIRSAVSRLPVSSKKVTVEYLLKRFVTDAERSWLDRHLIWFGTGLSDAALRMDGSTLPDLPRAAGGRDPLTAAMLVDYRSYLRDNLLVKVDRATMLSSVEARAPYLDRDLTRFALSLPSSLRVRGLTTKWVLKKAAEKWLPREVIYRRKRGLSVPIAGWINGSLREEVDRLLTPERLEGVGIEPSYVANLLRDHREGRANHARPLWAVVMLQYWRERWLERN
ncbi:MAG TPA: asparagine synthase C-terminal domain-containing protein, partial [Thermoanaerobaculia bacterium]|nr:asparagine synthase C-terminal domain-containing protein [Thermoanaerobaculia bacterium]